jgi:RNA 3'-terminal phosphate cyclase (ATP)
MLTIDGSQGEGGGQILRTSLALSIVTGRPVRIERIRAGRRKPGLRQQHLTAVRAAAAVSGGEVEGQEVGSQTLSFHPGSARPGEHRFEIGTAGSTTLVLQTVLPALLAAPGPSRLMLEGGTHNPMAPPFDFLQRAFLPLVSRTGPRLEATLARPGFYPRGGGRVELLVEPAATLSPFELLDRGAILKRRARAVVARLPTHIGRREVKRVGDRLGWPRESLQVEEIVDCAGPGNVLLIEIECEHVTEVFSGFGERGVRAERVADLAIQQVRRYLSAGVPVGPFLADQLLLPLALAGSGAFRTVQPTDHTRTNIEVIKQFLELEIRVEELGPDDWRIELGEAGA